MLMQAKMADVVAGGGGPQSLKAIIDGLGYGTSLALVLDAGDAISYPGSGQTFTDLSGGAQNFYLGATSSAAADDPTFNGAAGALSPAEFMSFDGGDDFIETSTALNFAEGLHKNNGVGTFIFFCRIGAINLGEYLFATNSSNTTSGCAFGITNWGPPGSLDFRVGNGSASSFIAESTGLITAGSDTMLSFAINEATGAGGLRFQINTAESTHTSTYSSPSASASASPYRIGSRAGANKLSNGTRLYACAAWNRQLPKAEIDAIYAAFKAGRLPTLP